jgi:tRNA splicing ligase
MVTLTACFNMAEATKSKAGKNSQNLRNTDGFVLSNRNEVMIWDHIIVALVVQVGASVNS